MALRIFGGERQVDLSSYVTLRFGRYWYKVRFWPEDIYEGQGQPEYTHHLVNGGWAEFEPLLDGCGQVKPDDIPIPTVGSDEHDGGDGPRVRRARGRGSRTRKV